MKRFDLESALNCNAFRVHCTLATHLADAAGTGGIFSPWTTSGMNRILAYFGPEELPGVLRLLDLTEETKRIKPKEAAAWRERIEAWLRFRWPGKTEPDQPETLLVDCPDPFVS